MLLSSIAFVTASAAVLYIVFLYPLLLVWFARRKAQPVLRTFEPRTVTLVMAVHNGERWIADKLQSIRELRYPRELLHVIIVSDGSKDRTDAIVREFGDPGIELIRVPHGGKALALNAGIARAEGEILFFTDVRQKLEPDCLTRLVECFADPAVGVVSGELCITDPGSSEERHTGLYWRYEKSIRKGLHQIDSIPGATGCIYAMRRELAEPMPAGTLLDDMYLPLGAFFRGYRVVMEESAKAYDVPTGLNAEFRRKVRTLAGVYQILREFPALLTTSNRMLVHFVSHKLGRLLLPFALLTILVTSFALAWPFGAVALLAQGGFYSIAMIDPWVPEGFPLKRHSSAVRTFVVLMAAALWAVSIAFRPSDTFWTAPAGSRLPSLPKGSPLYLEQPHGPAPG